MIALCVLVSSIASAQESERPSVPTDSSAPADVYYVLGDFEHGMQLGAEAIYLYLDGDGTSSIQVSGAGFALGPFVGYKTATNIGFTFDAQLGVEYLVASGNASDGTNSASA